MFTMDSVGLESSLATTSGESGQSIGKLKNVYIHAVKAA
jgi:hypothetical protein